MSTYYLISFLFIASIFSCSAFFLPIYKINDQYYPLMKTYNDDNLRYLLSSSSSSNRQERSVSSQYYPRIGRNTWFRVATYQQFKPTVAEEAPTGDHLMRWGR